MTSDPITQPEPWLRGPVEGISDALQPVAHAFIAAREDVVAPVAGLTTAQVWAQPGGAASIGFHLMHLAGAAVEHALTQVGETRDGELSAVRFVGRARLPSTVRRLLFHAAEHATRHAGQLITTAKIVCA